MGNVVSEAITRVAKVSDGIVEFNLKWDEKLEEYKIPELFGSVYGFAIRVENEEDKKKVFDAITKENRRNEKNVKELSDWKSLNKKEGCPGYYPLYWGKSIAPYTRIKDHINGAKGNNGLLINSVMVLQHREIAYASVGCGAGYANVEKNLHERYPDILKTEKYEEVC